MSVTTRPYCAKDWKTIQAICAKSFKKTYDKDYLKQLVNDPKRITTVVIRRRSVVGFMILKVEPQAYLDTIAIAPAWRRYGLGSHLMALAEQQAKKHGSTMLFLDMHMKGPLKWYQKRGFTVTRQQGFVTFKDGTKSRLLGRGLFWGSVRFLTAEKAEAAGK
jgi:ribosomal protein S18 acetylase RimI-like enzyme